MPTPASAIGALDTAGGPRSRQTATPMQWLVIAGCTLLALLARLYYVETVVIDGPIRGDAVAYFSYASNLAEHGVSHPRGLDRESRCCPTAIATPAIRSWSRC